MVHRFGADDGEMPAKRSGRPVNNGFETEVLDEAVRVIYRHEAGQGTEGTSSGKKPHELSTNFVIREAALTVHDKFYLPDGSEATSSSSSSGDSNPEGVQKWKTDPLTCKLKFSNQWILKMLARHDVHSWDVAAAIASEQGSAAAGSNGGHKDKGGKGAESAEMVARVQSVWDVTVCNASRKRKLMGTDEFRPRSALMAEYSGDALSGLLVRPDSDQSDDGEDDDDSDVDDSGLGVARK